MTDHGHDHGSNEGLERVTAPMQEYTMRKVTIGLLILLVGLVVTFGIPLALA